MSESQPTFAGNAEHLQVIRKAVAAGDASLWNTWREEVGVDRPDLRGASLDGIVLHEVNLQFADLTRASLRGAVITASLDHANLNEADLTDARLWLCRLDETQLRGVTGNRCEFKSSRIVA